MDTASIPHVWPLLASLIFLAILGVHAWRRRDVPGAKPFAFACLFGALWIAGACGEELALDVGAKVQWYRFQAAWQLPAVTAITCFTLDYVFPGRWLTRRNLVLASVPSLVAAFLVIAPGVRHLVWRGVAFGLFIRPLYAPIGWILVGYAMGLIVVNIAAFAWLFARSPYHRWPVALIVLGQAASRGVYVFEVTNPHFASRVVFLSVEMMCVYSMYAVALFGFRMFAALPAARRMAVDQMRDGMVVFDARWCVLSLNPSAERIFDLPATRAPGKPWQQILASFPDPFAFLGREANPRTITLGVGSDARDYLVDLSTLKDHRGSVIGYLLLLRDVTEPRKAQERLLERRMEQAKVTEREQLAHELHDGVSQDLAFLNLQAMTVGIYLDSGQRDAAKASLDRLAEVARELQSEVREVISYLLAVGDNDQGFSSVLRRVLSRFEQQTGLPVRLDVAGFEDMRVGTGQLFDPAVLSPATAVQLLRIIQESLTNVRKHAANATEVALQIRRVAGQMQVRVTDNGVGFDTKARERGSHFGLQVMHKRAARVGGRLAVESAPGRGTRVEIWVPMRAAGKVGREKESHEAAAGR